jgi:fructan beta-fructosidase
VTRLALLLVLVATAAGPAAEPLYSEALRPQYHFTAKSDSINDPNGLFHLDGTYHLFFQTGPITAKRWGHAVSKDLLRWEQLDDAIVPHKGFAAFSGCAVIDRDNTAGFAKPDAKTPAVVAVFTSWGEGQCLAFSLDAGKTWERYDKNPVLALPNDKRKSFPLSARDPHVMWDATAKRWVMVLYDNRTDTVDEKKPKDQQGGFSLFTSPDLKEWTRRSHLPGFYVCPDVFELPVEGEKKSAWVAMDWKQYAVGEFTGTEFKPKGEKRLLDFGKHLSANQTWKNLPDGRVVQICWVRGDKFEGMPFDQQLSIPTELSLRRIGGELRLCKRPVAELKTLHAKDDLWQDGKAVDTKSKSFDLSCELTLGETDALTLGVLGHPIELKRNAITAFGTTARLDEPLTDVRVLADVTSIEIFANGGSVSMTFAVRPGTDATTVTAKATGTPKVSNASLRVVNSIWKREK